MGMARVNDERYNFSCSHSSAYIERKKYIFTPNQVIYLMKT